MKKYFGLIFLFAFCFELSANNLQVSNLSLTGQNTGSDYVMVRFDISWENSWRTDNLNGDGITNWDAAWLFVKYKKASDGAWYHATLNTTNTNHNNGSQGVNAEISQTDALGVFYHRSGNGTGTFSSTGVQLRWEYGTDLLSDDLNTDVAEIKVFGIEMVYVPQGSFYVGDGASTSRFHQGNNTANPFQITSEDALRLGNDDGVSLWATGSWDNPANGTMLSAEFPKGYNAFYCMKYEITQEQYVEFLNTLTRTQQNTRTGTNISGTSITNRYVMSNTSTMQYRNGIRCDATLHATDPVTFYCDYNGNGTGNEAGDGQNIACNFLSWADGTAYSDWSGLRPMTELEYEKACRGTANPVANEYAWGNTTIQEATGISNAGTSTEVPSNSSANCIYNNNASVQGPMRVGSCTSGSRSSIGASYYGIMELSGNLWERPVTIGNATGRGFTGINGNGSIDASGNANASNWPSTNAVGSGLRGGDWGSVSVNCRVSGRINASYAYSDRFITYGFRCVSGVVVP